MLIFTLLFFITVLLIWLFFRISTNKKYELSHFLFDLSVSMFISAGLNIAILTYTLQTLNGMYHEYDYNTYSMKDKKIFIDHIDNYTYVYNPHISYSFIRINNKDCENYLKFQGQDSRPVIYIGRDMIKDIFADKDHNIIILK